MADQGLLQAIQGEIARISELRHESDQAPGTSSPQTTPPPQQPGHVDDTVDEEAGKVANGEAPQVSDETLALRQRERLKLGLKILAGAAFIGYLCYAHQTVYAKFAHEFQEDLPDYLQKPLGWTNKVDLIYLSSVLVNIAQPFVSITALLPVIRSDFRSSTKTTAIIALLSAGTALVNVFSGRKATTSLAILIPFGIARFFALLFPTRMLLKQLESRHNRTCGRISLLASLFLFSFACNAGWGQNTRSFLNENIPWEDPTSIVVTCFLLLTLVGLGTFSFDSTIKNIAKVPRYLGIACGCKPIQASEESRALIRTILAFSLPLILVGVLSSAAGFENSRKAFADYSSGVQNAFGVLGAMTGLFPNTVFAFFFFYNTATTVPKLPAAWRAFRDCAKAPSTLKQPLMRSADQ